MSTRITAEIVDPRTTFDAYCIRHRVGSDTAIAELVHLALGLPAEVLDYLREQRTAAEAAA